MEDDIFCMANLVTNHDALVGFCLAVYHVSRRRRITANT